MVKKSLQQTDIIFNEDSELVSTVCLSKLSFHENTCWAQIKIPENKLLLAKEKEDASQTENKIEAD